MVERGYALLGYAVAGGTAGVLLATRVRDKVVLPGGHVVYLVADSQWTLVPLQVGYTRRASCGLCWRRGVAARPLPPAERGS